MKISVTQVTDTGRVFQEVRTAESLDLPGDLFSGASPLNIRASFQRAGDEMLGRFEADWRYRQICSRCLEEFEIEMAPCFDIAFDIERGIDVIECDDDIRQELIMAIPVKPVCFEGCRGLCPGCGRNLNKEACHCKNVNGISHIADDTP